MPGLCQGRGAKPGKWEVTTVSLLTSSGQSGLLRGHSPQVTDEETETQRAERTWGQISTDFTPHLPHAARDQEAFFWVPLRLQKPQAA